MSIACAEAPVEPATARFVPPANFVRTPEAGRVLLATLLAIARREGVIK